MTKNNKENLINVDGKEYKIDKLSDKAKFCINALNNNQQKKNTLELEMNNVDICLDYYSKELKKELEDY